MFRAIRTSPPGAMMAFLWPYLRRHRARLIAAAGLALMLSLVELSAPLLIGHLIDRLVQDAAWRQYPWVIAGLTLLAMGRGFLLAQRRSLEGRIGEGVAAELRNRLWRHMQCLPLEYTVRRGSGRLLVRFISDTRAVQRLVTYGLLRMSQEMMLCGVIGLALLLLNWRMTLLVLVVLPCYGLIFRRLNPQLRRHSRATRRRRSRLAAYLTERINGMVAVKAHVREPDEARRMHKLNRALARRGSRMAQTAGNLEGLAAVTVAACGALAFALAPAELQAGRLSTGSLVAFYIVLGMLLPIFQRLVIANRYFQEAGISIDRLRETLARPVEPANRTGQELLVHAGQITFQHVSFSYQHQRPLLRGISLQLQRGELVALVGPNGAGKSSLLDLLLRFQRPDQGQICIDGQDISTVQLASLRRQIGLVSQHTTLFSGTIAENIRYGIHHGIPEEQLLRAARISGIEQMVAELPAGWQTMVGNGGDELSGGQRQRIALARALAADPPIVLLDEATAALDVASEHLLARQLRELAREKTVLVVAHRLPLLQLADRIYVLDGGRVVECGRHEELLQQAGVYRRLFGNALIPGQAA